MALTGFSSRRHRHEVAGGPGTDGEGKQRGKDLAQRGVGCCATVATGACRKALPGEGALEQGEEVVGIGKFGGGIHRGAIATEIALVEFGIEAAKSGTQHHAEFAGAVEADAQVDRSVARRAGCSEPLSQCGEQVAQFALV